MAADSAQPSLPLECGLGCAGVPLEITDMLCQNTEHSSAAVLSAYAVRASDSSSYQTGVMRRNQGSLLLHSLHSILSPTPLLMILSALIHHRLGVTAHNNRYPYAIMETDNYRYQVTGPSVYDHSR